MLVRTTASFKDPHEENTDNKTTGASVGSTTVAVIWSKTGISAELLFGDKPIAFDEFKATQTKDVFDFRDSSEYRYMENPIGIYVCMNSMYSST